KVTAVRRLDRGLPDLLARGRVETEDELLGRLGRVLGAEHHEAATGHGRAAVAGSELVGFEHEFWPALRPFLQEAGRRGLGVAVRALPLWPVGRGRGGEGRGQDCELNRRHWTSEGGTEVLRSDGAEGGTKRGGRAVP